MRKQIVAGNWKMNKNVLESKELASEIVAQVGSLELENTRVILAPTFVNLSSVLAVTKGSEIEVAAQNMHQASNGAFTGEISGEMLTALGLGTVILGHSERREYFGESNELLAEKVNAALDNNLEVIFCFGEVIGDRKSGNHFTIVENQIKKGLFHLSADQWQSIVLAYEPVWAIGTGETASPEQAQEMHAFIRDLVRKQYGSEVAENVSILYGGSVKPSNAKQIFSKPDVDGGLIGGAALDADNFMALVTAF
jgi:triosephosphate isomerase